VTRAARPDHLDLPLLLVEDLVRLTRAGMKTTTMRPMTAANSLIGGHASRKLFGRLDFLSHRVFVDKGPSPMGNPGPYLHVPDDDPEDPALHRVYSRVQPGDAFWVRERARVIEVNGSGARRMVRLRYEVDEAESGWVLYPPRLATPVIGHCVANGVHREGARTWLDVTSVQPRRPVDVDELEARADGFPCELHPQGNPPGKDCGCYVSAPRFRNAWREIYGEASLAGWAWSYGFAFRGGGG